MVENTQLSVSYRNQLSLISKIISLINDQMKSESKKNLTGKLFEKEDLGKYSKSQGIKPLVKSGKKESHARLYK